jgi:serine/threonine protein kinase
VIKMEELAVNPIISHYRILSKLGAGGMGEVYRAHDTKLNLLLVLHRLPEVRRMTRTPIASSTVHHDQAAGSASGAQACATRQ